MPPPAAERVFDGPTDRVEAIELTVRGGIAERLVMTLSAAEHRGTALYVAVMRLLGT